MTNPLPCYINKTLRFPAILLIVMVIAPNLLHAQIKNFGPVLLLKFTESKENGDDHI